MGEFDVYLREYRHIFSVCPECSTIGRLSELELERKGRYLPDWLDQIETKIQTVGERKFGLESKAKELRDKARRKAEEELLPKRLEEIAPSFARRGINPRDVSPLFDPVEFVVFKGLSSGEGVQDVLFYSVGESTSRNHALEASIRSRSYSWNLLRVSGDGSLSQSRRYGANRSSRSLDEFQPSESA